MELPVRHDGIWVREHGFCRVYSGAGGVHAHGHCRVADVSRHAHPRRAAGARARAVVLVYQALERAKCEITDVAQARALPAGAELEVVVQNPGWQRRGARA